MEQIHKRKEIELLIFDLDGTLIDSGQDLANSVNYVRRKFKLSEFSLDQVMQYVGDGAKKLIARSFPDATPEKLDEAQALFKQYYQEHIFDNTRPYPWVIETLDFFSGKKKAIISNKPVTFTQQIADRLFPRKFDLVLGGDSLPEKKPKPEPIFKVLEETGTLASRAVIVGDGAPDIESGKAAGVTTCAVTYGFRTRDFLLQYKPDFCIDSMRELMQIFT